MTHNGVSVVIPVKNRQKDLLACVQSVKRSYDSLFAQRKAYVELQLIVVDDHSDEDIAGALSSFSFVTVIKNTGIGPGAARNCGIVHAKFELVGFIDSDCVADKGWLLQVVTCFETHDVYAVQGNPCLFMKKNNPCLGRCEEKLYLGLFKSYVRGNFCTQIDTRNCAFRKTLPHKLGTDIFIVDMKKAQAEARVCGNNLVAKGIKILYVPNMLVYHKDPSSIINSMKQKMRHGSGRIYVWKKTPSFFHLFTRYYWNPIFKFGVPFWYVIPTHSAFIWGYFRAKWRKK